MPDRDEREREKREKQPPIFDEGQTERDRDPGKPTREPGRTPGTAEGGDDRDPGKPTREPGRTPGQAEG